jgi:uncharacterized protein
MSFKETLLEDMKSAMRAGEKIKLGTIRLLLSELKNAEIDAGELDEAGFHKVVAKLAKQVREGIEEFAKAGRSETVAEETEKLVVLEAYLPTQLSDSDLQQIVADVKNSNPNLQGGQLIGAVMAKVKGQADGKRVSAAIASLS